MIFVDTHYILALVNKADQHHQCAVELSVRCENERLLTTVPVLLEIGNALARRFRDDAIAIIERAHRSADTTLAQLTPELLHAGLMLFRSHRDKEWGLVDCISFFVMREFGVNDALTHDRHFEQAGFRALMRDGA